MKPLLRALAILGALVATILFLPGASWASSHDGLSAVVSADGSAVFTADVPVAADTEVMVETYTGTWGPGATQTLYRSTPGVIPQGETTVTLKADVPPCGPYQVDAVTGHAVQPIVTYPQGSLNVLKGQAYPNAEQSCESPSPSPTPSPTFSHKIPKPPTPPVTSAPPAAAPTPKASVGSAEQLAHTGGNVLPVLGVALLLLTLGALLVRPAVARKPHKH